MSIFPSGCPVARRQFRQRLITGTTRRSNKSWTSLVNTGASGIAANAKVLLGSFSLSNPGIDETVLRTVGTILVYSDQTAGSEGQLGAFGLIVVSDTALALGITAVPGPVTDGADDGWFLYQPINQRLNVASGVGLNPDFGIRYDFDSKAKRVVSDGKGMAIVVENASAAFAFNITITIRILSMVTGT